MTVVTTTIVASSRLEGLSNALDLVNLALDELSRMK